MDLVDNVVAICFEECIVCLVSSGRASVSLTVTPGYSSSSTSVIGPLGVRDLFEVPSGPIYRGGRPGIVAASVIISVLQTPRSGLTGVHCKLLDRCHGIQFRDMNPGPSTRVYLVEAEFHARSCVFITFAFIAAHVDSVCFTRKLLRFFTLLSLAETFIVRCS